MYDSDASVNSYLFVSIYKYQLHISVKHTLISSEQEIAVFWDLDNSLAMQFWCVFSLITIHLCE
jgi:hypothetical protein